MRGLSRLLVVGALLPLGGGPRPVGQTVAAAERDIVFVAHRGGIVAGYPENTLAAFRHAIAWGAQVLEADLRGTKDGHAVIIHDRTLDRTTDGTGPVGEHTLAELKRLDAGGGEAIPTFEELLRLIKGTSVQVLLDIKRGRSLNRGEIVRLTEEYDAVPAVIAGVRSLKDLREIQAMNPDLRTLGLISRSNRVDEFVAAGVDIVRLKAGWIHAKPELVAKVHALGKPVWVTAGAARKEELETLIARGVDGIISDRPQLMHELIVHRQ